MKRIALCAVLAGCSAHLGDSDQNGSDAAVRHDSGSSGGDGALPTDGAAAACASGRQVYLNFDGVTLNRGAPSDASQDRASWMANASGTLPPYRQGDTNRTTEIQSIIDGVKARLATTPITVVTTRPSSGPYVMVVFGGTRDIIGTPYSYATNEHDCGDPVKNDVGWVSDVPSVSYAQDLTIGAIGWGLGLNGTNEVTDCMCAWANNCSSASGACTLSASIATTTSLSPATTCPNQNPQNEVAAFSTSFCQ